MNCIKCGNTLLEGAKFCNKCGTPQQQIQQAQSVPAVQPQTGQHAKSKLTAGLLGVFLGWLGIHNFYLGQRNKGIIKIVAYAATWLFYALTGSVIGMLLNGAVIIWGIAEGIMILSGKITTDGSGNPLI